MNITLRRIATIGVSTAVAAVGLAAPAYAAEPAWEVTFPAGLACTFPLVISGSEGGPQVSREFRNPEGNVIRTLVAGTGVAMTYTNGDTGASFSTEANGAVIQVRKAADGTSTSSMTGHVVVIMYPTDNPPGPSSTLYTGRVVTTVDADGNTTSVQASGIALDICAALS